MIPRAFTIEPYERFSAGIRAIANYEIRPQNTVTFLHTVDLTRLEAVRAEAAARGAQKPSYTAFVVKAIAVALREFPYANRRLWGWWWLPFFRTRLQRFNRRDITVAVERNLPGIEVAVFSDIIRDADELSLTAITERLAALSRADATTNEQWRRFSTLLTRYPHWLSTLFVRMPVFFPGLWAKFRGAATMVSSPARYGVDAIASTWTSPLGVSFGVVELRPTVKEGKVVACPTFVLTLNFDRRVMAGAQAARFFQRVAELLETSDERVQEPASRMGDGLPVWQLEPPNRYVATHRRIVENEIRPKYTVSFLHEVDLSQVEELRAQAAAAGVKPSYTAFVAKAVARAMREFPYANARVWGWPGIPLFRTRVQRFHRADVAIAVERNLPGVEVATFIDVIRDVDDRSLASITEWLRERATGDATKLPQWAAFSRLMLNIPTWLASRVIALPLRFPSLWARFRGGSVLISSPAKYGIDAITASWSWALGVSFGVVKDRPFVQDLAIVSRPSFNLTLNFDRRFMAVAQAARFFRRIVDILESAQTSLAEPAGEAPPAAPSGEVARSAADYTIEPHSRFVAAYRSMVDFEMEPQRTVTFIHHVDLTEIEDVRRRARAEGQPAPSYTAFVAKAAAVALKEFPYANRRLWTKRWAPFRSPRLQQFHRRDVAVAIERSLPGIQVAASVDLVRNADELTLGRIMQSLETFDVSDITVNERWRRFSFLVARLPYWLSTLALRMPVRFPELWVEYRGGAILINAPGEQGIDVLTGEWCWPLGVSLGRASLRPVVRQGEVVPCPTFTLTLTWDRRVMAGAQAARFFRRMMDALEHARTELAGVRAERVTSEGAA